jgi:cell division protein FtsB
MPDASAPTPESHAATLARLTKDYDELNRQKLAVEAELKQARKTEEALVAEAIKKFGTGDPAELRKLYDARMAANEARLTTYSASLADIRSQLQTIDTAE